MHFFEVMLYYWDDRDGSDFSGWWFGPKVGGDQVWAYQPGKDKTPPETGWKAPMGVEHASLTFEQIQVSLKI